MSTSGGSGSAGVLQVATAHLTAATILTMFSVPTQIVAAPGANKTLIVVNVFGQYVAGTDTYVTNGIAGIYYAAPSATDLRAGTAFSSLLSQNPPPASLAVPNPDGATGSFRPATSAIVNKALVVGMTTADPYPAGPIVTTTLGSGGLGYAAGDTGTIGPDPDTADTTATYTVLTVAAVTGAVLTYTVTGAGVGYSTHNNAQPTAPGGGQPGAGAGLTVNVTAIHAADGDLYVTALYYVATIN